MNQGNRHLSHVKANANRRNMCQQLPLMLDVVGQQCWVHLHAWALTLFRRGGGLTPHRIKSFNTHERLRLQCSYFVTFPQIYLGAI